MDLLSTDNSFTTVVNSDLHEVTSLQNENNNSTNSNCRNSTTTEESLEVTDPSSEDDNIVLCILWDKGKLGAAYYNLISAQISVVPDILDWGPYFRIMKSLYSQVQPQKVISINKITDNVVKALVSVITDAEVDLVEKLPESLHLISRKAHAYETCKRRVLSVKLISEPESISEEERRTYLQTMLDFSSEVMIHALGILLMYIDKYWGFLQNDEECLTPRFYSINIISLKHLVLIDDETYKALQIFSSLDNFKKGDGSFDKQHPSIFGLFRNCRTVLGTRKMRDFFVHPTNNRNILENRHNVILFLLNPNNEDILKGISDSLRHITNLNPIFTKLRGMTAKISQWRIFHKVRIWAICSCVVIGDLLRPHSEICQLFRDISTSDTTLLHVATCVKEVIDLNADNVNVSIKLGIDLDLDLKKSKFEKLEAVMNMVANEELKNLPEYIKECRICYIAEIGYILEVKKWKELLLPEDINSIQFKLLFCTKTHVIYKSPSCMELDTQLGDVLVEILAHEVRIIVRLVQFIEKHISLIQNYLNMLAELDCLLSMAKVASEFNLVRPKFTDERIIHIKDGRHLLLELSTNSFVPNDYNSNLEDGLVKIITGANASGKSVYMKQVAIITYLVHIGSFVPATSVRMCLLDNIHTRIKTLESVSTGVSTFLIDLRQMAHAMYSSTNKSLIVIDEFGNGTTELDGVALLTASLEGFIEQPRLCPHIMVSTHYNQLGSILPASPVIKYQMTELTFDTQGNLIYLYKIIEGKSQSSHAITVAENENLPPHIVARTRELVPAIQNGGPFPARLAQPRVDRILRRGHNFYQILFEKEIEELHLFDFVQILEI